MGTGYCQRTKMKHGEKSICTYTTKLGDSILQKCKKQCVKYPVAAKVKAPTTTHFTATRNLIVTEDNLVFETVQSGPYSALECFLYS